MYIYNEAGTTKGWPGTPRVNLGHVLESCSWNFRAVLLRIAAVGSSVKLTLDLGTQTTKRIPTVNLEMTDLHDPHLTIIRVSAVEPLVGGFKYVFVVPCQQMRMMTYHSTFRFLQCWWPQHPTKWIGESTDLDISYKAWIMGRWLKLWPGETGNPCTGELTSQPKDVYSHGSGCCSWQYSLFCNHWTYWTFTPLKKNRTSISWSWETQLDLLKMFFNFLIGAWFGGTYYVKWPLLAQIQEVEVPSGSQRWPWKSTN